MGFSCTEERKRQQIPGGWQTKGEQLQLQILRLMGHPVRCGRLDRATAKAKDYSLRIWGCLSKSIPKVKRSTSMQRMCSRAKWHS
jgi:hypothetical protein